MKAPREAKWKSKHVVDTFGFYWPETVPVLGARDFIHVIFLEWLRVVFVGGVQQEIALAIWRHAKNSMEYGENETYEHKSKRAWAVLIERLGYIYDDHRN